MSAKGANLKGGGGGSGGIPSDLKLGNATFS